MNRIDKFPAYHFPRNLRRKLIASLIKGSKRSILKDAQRAISGIIPPIHIIGVSSIPESGPVLITMNHYTREGFFVIWAGLAIAAQLPENQTWLMTNAWTNRKPGLDQVRTRLSRFVFKRISKMYGAITTPALPAIPAEQSERMISIRKVFQQIHSDPEAVICIAPEGRDFPSGTLGLPEHGAGKFFLQLDKQIGRVVPVGVWEDYGRLIVNFGPSYSISEELFTMRNDTEISQFVINRIASLLPAHLRGI